LKRITSGANGKKRADYPRNSLQLNCQLRFWVMQAQIVAGREA